MQNATLVIRKGKIEAVGANLALPKDAVVIDCKGKYIYPAFIDIYSDYGIATQERPQTGAGFFRTQQITSNTKGAYGWNQAIKPEMNASTLFAADDKDAKALYQAGLNFIKKGNKGLIIKCF